jgi:hypothetical protein
MRDAIGRAFLGIPRKVSATDVQRILTIALNTADEIVDEQSELTRRAITIPPPAQSNDDAPATIRSAPITVPHNPIPDWGDDPGD